MSISPGSAASLLPSSLVQSALAAVLRPVQPSPFELLWASHPAWPAAATGRAGEDDEPATIACLDSSFNPPTTAHEALISAGLPPPRRSSSSSSDSKKSKPYAGHLLLLSVRNVDKVLKPGDASFEQRLQMIHLLASHLVSTNRCPNIAIGLLSAPAFVNKDRIVREWLRSRSEGATTPLRRLAWLIGTDTLIRFFDQRYYPTAPLPQALDSFFHPLPPNPPSLLIHFPRGGGSDGLSSPKKDDLAEAFYAQGLLRDGDPMEWDGVDRGWVSSTVVRERLRALDIGDGVEGGEKMALGDLVREGVERFARSEGLYR